MTSSTHITAAWKDFMSRQERLSMFVARQFEANRQQYVDGVRAYLGRYPDAKLPAHAASPEDLVALAARAEDSGLGDCAAMLETATALADVAIAYYGLGDFVMGAAFSAASQAYAQAGVACAQLILGSM